MEKEIARLRKNSGEALVVQLNTFNGHQLFSLRVFTHPDEKSPQGQPTKKGVTLPIALLPAVADALQLALTTAAAAGLVEPGRKVAA
jgi:hypothetical protein